ncbi:MAG TPA: PEP-CTERM sorting domain-containing protein [bacterium]|nr:PEP-CTERM sorting domain-containing protein [bacterium]
MGRIAPIARIGAAVLLLNTFASGSALAEDRQSRSVDLSTEYIKNVRPVDDGDMVKRRRLGTTEPRHPDGVVVPEPGTIALVTLGLAGMRLARRKKV